MSREDTVSLVKGFCQERQFRFVDDVLIGHSVLILITGDATCAKAFDLFLTEQGLEHTTPAMIIDGIGSYITVDKPIKLF